jgi:hypothetical protein
MQLVILCIIGLFCVMWFVHDIKALIVCLLCKLILVMLYRPLGHVDSLRSSHQAHWACPTRTCWIMLYESTGALGSCGFIKIIPSSPLGLSYKDLLDYVI